jgi:hypothetical protein
MLEGDSMAKMSKAQCRKRIDEASTKLRKIYLNPAIMHFSNADQKKISQIIEQLNGIWLKL